MRNILVNFFKVYIFSYLKWSDFVLNKLERVDIVPHHVQDLALESSEELFQL